MKIGQAFFLGIIQGLTEFLPISSSGHLILFQNIFGLNGNLTFFNLFLHLATLVAVVIVFKSQFLNILKHPFSKQAKMLYISCVPTVVLAFVFKSAIQNVSGVFLGVCFILTGISLIVSQKSAKINNSVFEINYKTSFLMGVAQGIAVFPGISRSGATISIGLLCGASKKDVADFSFFMSAPVIIGGFLLELLDCIRLKNLIIFNPWCLIFGFLSALLVGIFSLKTMLNAVKKLKFSYFSIYLFVIAIISFIFA